MKKRDQSHIEDQQKTGLSPHPNQNGSGKSLGKLLLALGQQPNKSILSGISDMLEESMREQGRSLGKVLLRRLNLNNYEFSSHLPELVDAISGKESNVPPQIKSVITNVTDFLFSTVSDDGTISQGSKPSLSDYIKLFSMIKKAQSLADEDKGKIETPYFNEESTESFNYSIFD